MSTSEPGRDGTPAARGYRPSLRHVVARRLLVQHLVTGIGDFVALGALLVVATERSGGRAVGAAGLLAVQVLPGLLAGTVLSARIAQLPSRTGLVGAALLGAAALLLVLGVPQLWAVYGTALLLGTSRAISGPLFSKAVAEHVPRELRPPVLALVGTNFQVVQVAGVFVGSLAATQGVATAALLFDLGTFLAAAALLLGLPRTRRADHDEDRRGALDGLRVIRDHPVARGLVPAAWASLLVGALPEAILPSVLTSPVLAPALAIGPAATAVTSWLVGHHGLLATPRAGVRAAAVVPAATALFGVAFLAPAGVPRGLLLVVAHLVLGATLGWIVGAQGALAVSVAPLDLAQLTATMVASVLVLEGIGALLVGVVADALTPTAAILLAAAVAGALVVVGARRTPSDATFHAARASTS